MNVLVFNAGSSSLKFGLFQCAATPRPIVVGEARDINKQESRLTAHDGNGVVIFEDVGAEDREGASRQIVAKLQGGEYPTPEVVGHRIVHGGSEVLDHCLIDDAVLRKLEDCNGVCAVARASGSFDSKSRLEQRTGCRTWPASIPSSTGPCPR